jgi:hypothetical protein
MPKPSTNMPTVRSRDLGFQLHQLMRTAGMSGHEIARRLDIYPSLLSYVTNGLRCLSDADLVAILVTCRVDRHERERLLRLNHDLTRRGWLQHHDATLSTWSRTLASHETHATRIVDMQTLMIPPLLQTEDYARTIFRRLTTSSTTLDTLLTKHRDRQAIFSTYPLPKMLFFLPETTLRASAGDAAMMSEQLQHLLVNAALPRVEIRVLPRAAGVHAGSAGSFTLLESDTFDPIIHLGGLTFEVFLEQPQQIDEHRRLITYLDAVALSNDESMTMISDADLDLFDTTEKKI